MLVHCLMKIVVSCSLSEFEADEGLTLFCETKRNETKRNEARYNETKGIMPIYFVLR